MSKRTGLLAVFASPSPAAEEEFNAWYDSEHVPERLAVPGFLSGVRHVCLSGHPRYLATYDLDGVDVLESPEYRAVAGANFGPWTRRVTGRAMIHRIVAEQVYPGGTVTLVAPTRLLVLRISHCGRDEEGAAVEAVRSVFQDVAEVSQIRVFRTVEGETDSYYAMLDLWAPLSGGFDFPAAPPLLRRMTLANTYCPYRLDG